MIIFKCKMCGGNLELTEGKSVGTCDSCGSTMTIPKLDDERRANLYDRANHFRRNNDFDKAATMYETILNEDKIDAEAYWSLVLCKYGVEYVEDPKTHKRVITCNRTQYASIMVDEDYKQAIANADEYQKRLYEEEAKTIDGIQKGILEISQKETPFDVFVCYKETDNNGRRTHDSVLAQDLYHQLTNEGFKVFFSRITLEDKIGVAYEPYIFAALNSAKIMVVIGTKLEHFNAVWVKNEWNRYLALIKGGAKKILIPAYRDMDAYDLPEDFSHLQAQDMSKLGFMQDLIRGIKKITYTNEVVSTQNEVASAQAGNISAPIESLLKRAMIFLEDGEFLKADEYLERILDLDPENASAYWGKLLAKLKCATDKQLKQHNQDLTQYNEYNKAIRFANKMELASFEKVNAEILNQIESELQALAEMRKGRSMFSAGGLHTLVINESQHVTAFGYNENQQCNTDNWTNIIQVSAGDSHSLGLCSDNRVVATGFNEEGACDVDAWTQIMQVSAGYGHSIGVKLDKTVIAVGDNTDGQCNVEQWKDIVFIAAGAGHSVGITSKGTVLATGSNEAGQCNVSNWENIVSVCAGSLHTVALKSDGSVIAIGSNEVGQCNVSNWNDIIKISSSWEHTVGLKADGTVVATGNNSDEQCNVKGWNNIKDIAAGYLHTIAIANDGQILSVGNNTEGQFVNNVANDF